MYLLFGHVLLCCLLSPGRVNGSDTALTIRGEVAHAGVQSSCDSSGRRANQPILSVGKAERVNGNDERPKHRSRRDLVGDCLPHAQFKAVHTASQPSLDASIAIQARGIRLQI